MQSGTIDLSRSQGLAELAKAARARNGVNRDNKPITGIKERTKNVIPSGGDLVIPNKDTLSPDQMAFIRSCLAGKNLCLTGGAGAGKSFVIQTIKEIYESKSRVVAMTSMTGNSAILIGGKTLHSWLGIGICKTKESALKHVMSFNKPQERMRNASLLIIDEISMCSGELLDIADYVLRIVRHDQRVFGGLQVILSGDFCQLKPVKAEKWAFQSERWGIYINEVHDLKTIFRQADPTFVKALSKIRYGMVDQETIDVFQPCMGRQFEGDILPTELFPVNEMVNSHNEDELWKLASEENRIFALKSDDTISEKIKTGFKLADKTKQEIFAKLDKECQAPKQLLLAKGAQVMLIKNLNVEGGLANGSRGIVTGFDAENSPIVRFLNGHEMVMQTHQWSIKFNNNIRVNRNQYPLKLAWAMSIHKSQGCTVDRVRVDFADRVFGDGMVYVALSRCRTLAGLSITSIDWSKVRISKAVKEFYEKYCH